MRRNSLSNSIVKRVIADIIMVMLIAWAPWWLIVIGAGTCLFVYNSYYEIILWGLCLDELYGAAYPLPYSLSATILACAALVGAYYLKKRLTFYK
jgi:hypothetical protein